MCLRFSRNLCENVGLAVLDGLLTILSMAAD